MSDLCKQNGEAYSEDYKDQIWRTLHTFFKYCVTKQGLPENPMREVRRPQLETGTKPRLSLSQVDQLLETVSATEQIDRNAAIVLLMVDSGLRAGEVVNLRLTDVNFDDNSAYIKGTKVRKTREVPLSDKTVAALEKYMHKRRSLASTEKGLFLTAKGPRKGQDVSRKAIEELMKRLQKRMGIPLYAHLLRHTFANLYIRKGELKKLSKILGHSRIDTTAKFYTDPDFPAIQEEHKHAAPTAQIAAKKKGRGQAQC